MPELFLETEEFLKQICGAIPLRILRINLGKNYWRFLQINFWEISEIFLGEIFGVIEILKRILGETLE